VKVKRIARLQSRRSDLTWDYVLCPDLNLMRAKLECGQKEGVFVYK
jgi:hypothetical protein